MIWWVRASLPPWAAVGYLVAVIGVLALGDIRLTYPTVGGNTASSAVSTLIAFLAPTVWVWVRVRARHDARSGSVRVRVPMLDVALLLAPIVLLALTQGVLTGARTALVPMVVYGALALVAALPGTRPELQALPAVALGVGMLVGHDGEGAPSPWALMIWEAPDAVSLLAASGLFVIAAVSYVLATIFRIR